MSNPPSRGIYLAILGAAVLAVAGGAAFWTASRQKPQTSADQIVTVDARSCQPNAITVPGGRRSFEIVNASDRPIEWEIVDGVMVVAERENIAPGFHATLAVQLAPGSYEMTCGLLTNPRGTLTVTASDEATAAASEVTLKKFLGPLSEYRVYLSRRSGELAKATEALSERIAAGDLEGARAAWLEARQPWRQIAPVSSRIGDLETSMDPLADYLAEREQDPGFTGFHRIEYGLWTTGSTEGLAPVAARLATDAGALRDRLKTLDLGPADLAGNAASLARRVSDQATASQAPYSQSDLAEFSADLDGIAKSALLIEPLVAEARPEVSATFHDAIATARKTLDGFRAADGSVPAYGSVDAAGRAKISAAFAQVADAAAALNPAIGLD